jgi:hypothetical protein
MGISYGSKRVEGVTTNNYGLDWLLVWNLDANGNTSSMSRPSIVTKDMTGCNAYTYVQLQAYKNGNWSEAMFTSLLYPNIRWVFTKSANATNLPIVLQTLLSGGNPATYMTINVAYNVTLDTTKSSYPIGGTSPLMFMHNWGTGELGDIPTLGNTGGYVWSTGMYWGQIDDYSNYGGLMNRTTAQIGATGGNTGDRLLMYVR